MVEDHSYALGGERWRFLEGFLAPICFFFFFCCCSGCPKLAPFSLLLLLLIIAKSFLISFFLEAATARPPSTLEPNKYKEDNFPFQPPTLLYNTLMAEIPHRQILPRLVWHSLLCLLASYSVTLDYTKMRKSSFLNT